MCAFSTSAAFVADTRLQPLVVWGILTGSGIIVLLGTGLVAWWLDRRSRRAIQLVEIDNALLPVPYGRGDVVTPEEAVRDFIALRTAATRAAEDAADARHDSERAARILEIAEQAYEEAHRAHTAALTASASTASTIDITMSDMPVEAREVNRATLGAYRRGELSAEELRRVWYSLGGWDAGNEAAERETRELRVNEVTTRQEYHRALAAAQAARQHEYVTETAARALTAETAAAAAEMGAVWRPPEYRAALPAPPRPAALPAPRRAGALPTPRRAAALPAGRLSMVGDQFNDPATGR